MNKAGKILSLHPSNAIVGGEILLKCEDFRVSDDVDCRVFFDDIDAHIVGASASRVLATVPDNLTMPNAEIYLENGEDVSNKLSLTVGEKLVGDMHIVANPAVDPNDNSIVLTRSGSRGQELPVTLFRLEPDGYLDELPIEFMNPTGVAFASSGQLFVTNRAEGKVCRISRDGTVIPFGNNLGVATGIAFDKHSFLYVGDRGGTIWRGKNIDDFEVFATLEPSVAAYHLAFGPDGNLYVSAPQLSSFDNIWRVDKYGEVEVFYRGLGRPQGLAFDTAGNLYVAACLHGKRGIVRITPDREAELFVAGNNIIGLCFTKRGEMIVATSDTVYRLNIGIYGTLLD
jgi:sugar lactone lactonase YvrE